MNKVIAVDFDGTLCTDAWPDVGAPRLDVIRLLKGEQRRGAKVILWTCREGQPLADAIEFCRQHGLTLDAVNDNIPERTAHYGANPRKVGADEYWDDRAVLVGRLSHTDLKERKKS